MSHQQRSSRPEPLSITIINGDRSAKALWPNSTKYSLVKECVDIVIRVLETPQGQKSLVGISKELLGLWPAYFSSLHGVSVSELPRVVNEHLCQLKKRFPHIFIRTIRCDIITVQGRSSKGSAGCDMIDPGRFFLSKRLIDKIVSASEQQIDATGFSLEVLKFRFIVAIGRGMVQILMGRFLGNEEVITPPSIVPHISPPSMDLSEVGTLWESTLFGGLIEYFGDRSDLYKSRRSGVPYSSGGAYLDKPTQRICLTYITEFVHGG